MYNEIKWIWLNDAKYTDAFIRTASLISGPLR